MAEAARRAAVRSPATSANLGPGFDSFGLCLGLYDDLAAMTTPTGLVVQASGEGAGDVPTDENHLVVRSLRAALDVMGVAQPGLSVVTENRIPHGRGLGSSAAAIVAGIMLAEGLFPERGLGSEAKLELAAVLEGHPDNVAACLMGGFSIAWSDAKGAYAVRLDVDPRVNVKLLVPEQSLSTEVARSALPSQVPHRDAASNSGRAALLVAALTRDPRLLLVGTEDRLHQAYRAAAMPQTMALVNALREQGVAAVVSGAGPAVLVLETGDSPDLGVLVPDGWETLSLSVEHVGAALIQPG
jgi:homoserine kinase